VYFVVGDFEPRDWPDECPACGADEHQRDE
jgi:hypothetical protein